MAISISFDPASGDFGTVDGVKSVSFALSVDGGATATEAVTASLTGGTSFSIVGSNTPLQSGDSAGTITVTFGGSSSDGTFADTLELSTVTDGVVASLALSATVDTVTELDTTNTYLHLEVPDYGSITNVVPRTAADATNSVAFAAATTTTNTQPTSFLRMGAFDWSKETGKAADLVKDHLLEVTSARDPDNTETQITIDFDGSNSATGVLFADDVRTRSNDVSSLSSTGGDDPDHGLTKQQRRDESTLFYSKGGWRDHTDGNRLTTTYGDKVEIIRGNYKMIVLGRNDSSEQAMGWDVAGGHIQDYAPGTMPGASFFLEWIDDERYYSGGQKGVWLLANTTENVYEYARFAGNKRDEEWGDVFETYIGSENPPEDTPVPGFGSSPGGATVTDGAAIATGSTLGTHGHEPPERLSGRHYDLPAASSTTCGDCSGVGTLTLPCPLCGGTGNLVSFGDCPTCAGVGSLSASCGTCAGSGTYATNSGRSTPTWTNDNDGLIRSNPHVIEKIWAAQVDCYLGTENWRIPKINENHYSVEFSEVVNCSGDFTTDFDAANFTETFDATGTITEKRTAATVFSKTEAADVEEQFWGKMFSLFMGNHLEVFVGASESFKFGGFVDATVGLFEVNIDICAGIWDMVICGPQMDITVSQWHCEFAMFAFEWEWKNAAVVTKAEGTMHINWSGMHFVT